MIYHRYTDLEATLTELQAFYKQRETKSEATIQQQTKLIDYLQKRIEDANKKKKVCINIDGNRILYQIFLPI
jgi:DNA repair protein RadC